MSAPEPKRCADCKHCVCSPMMPEPMCYAPGNANLVLYNTSCALERSAAGNCGRTAILFEPRPARERGFWGRIFLGE